MKIYDFTIYLLTVSFNIFPTLKTGTVDAGIFISSLVLGFLPVLAALCFVSNTSNSTNLLHKHRKH